jgi:hypothetical protein
MPSRWRRNGTQEPEFHFARNHRVRMQTPPRVCIQQYPVSLSSISHEICTVGDGQRIADATRNIIAPQPELYNRIEVAQQLAALDATAASWLLLPRSLPVLLLQQLAVVAQQLAALDVWLMTSQSNGGDATLEQGVGPRANGDGHGGERCWPSRQTGGQADELTETWTEREKGG